MLSFVEKYLIFTKKMCLFIFCIFHLNEEELNQHVRLIKYVENWISNSTSRKKKENRRKEQEHNPIFKNIISETPEKLSLFRLVTNYHKLSLLSLVVRLWRKFEKTKFGVKFWILLFLLKISYIFIASTKDLNLLQINTENETSKHLP